MWKVEARRALVYFNEGGQAYLNSLGPVECIIQLESDMIFHYRADGIVNGRQPAAI